MGTPVKWTADTERAFLLALTATGQVANAAAAIGRSTSACYSRRDRHPAFEAAWAQALERIEGENLDTIRAARELGEPTPARPLNRTRRDGWTAQRTRAFCRALANHGDYKLAAAEIGISYTSVKKLRRQSPEFQALCDKALVDGGLTVTEAAHARAVEGWEEPIFHAGQIIGTRHRFSEGLLKTLVEQEADAKTKAAADKAAAEAADGLTAHAHYGKPRGQVIQPATQAEIDAALMKRLDVLARILAREDKAKQDAWCERMKQQGWAP